MKFTFASAYTPPVIPRKPESGYETVIEVTPDFECQSILRDLHREWGTNLENQTSAWEQENTLSQEDPSNPTELFQLVNQFLTMKECEDGRKFHLHLQHAVETYPPGTPCGKTYQIPYGFLGEYPSIEIMQEFPDFYRLALRMIGRGGILEQEFSDYISKFLIPTRRFSYGDPIWVNLSLWKTRNRGKNPWVQGKYLGEKYFDQDSKMFLCEINLEKHPHLIIPKDVNPAKSWQLYCLIRPRKNNKVPDKGTLQYPGLTPG